MPHPHQRLGLVAGRGDYPSLFVREAKRAGVEHLAVVALRGETRDELAELADSFDWTHVGQLGKAIGILRAHRVQGVVFAGQIRPARLFGDIRPDLRAAGLLAKLALKNAESIFGAVAAEFEKDGLTVLPATSYLEHHLAAAGANGRHQPSKAQLADIAYGRRIADEISRLDIGQTVVVKKGTVLAVEAFEGTDPAIKRGGELGKGDVTVVKVAKPGQDLRFDVPCIGLRTVESLREAGAGVLALHAGHTLLLDKPRVIAALDQARIVCWGL